MARQAGPLFFTGTIGDLVFYKLGDHYYIRQLGEPTPGVRKRMKDPNCYPVLNMRKREFGQASTLASKAYRQLPKAERKHGVQGKLTSIAMRLLREGKTEEEVKVLLVPLYLGGPVAEQPQEPTALAPVAAQTEDKVVAGDKKKQPAVTRFRAIPLPVGGHQDRERMAITAVHMRNNEMPIRHSTKGYCAPCRVNVNSS